MMHSSSSPEEPPLLAIGFWKERLDDALPLPMEAEAALDPSVREAVVNYLDAGTVVERYRGYSYCRYGCEGPLGSAELSDGKWLWPEGYGHYLRAHGVIAPPQFVEHVLHMGSSPRVGVAPSATRQASSDMWTSWGASLRTAGLTRALEAAKHEAWLRCDRALEIIGKEQESKFGVSNAPCLSEGCTRPALCGRAICARCVADERRMFELQKTEHLIIRDLMHRMVADIGSKRYER